MPEEDNAFFVWCKRSTDELIVWDYTTSYLMAIINDIESDCYLIGEL